MGGQAADQIDEYRRQTLKLLGLGALLPIGGLSTSPSQVAASDSSSATTSGSPRTGIDDVILVEEETIPIGPGVQLTSFVHLDPDGWVSGELLDIDLAEDAVSTDLLSPGIPDLSTVSEMTADAGATAAINGDFFHGITAAPLGAELKDGEMRKHSEHITNTTFAVDTDGLGQVLDVILDGSVTIEGDEVELAGLNPIELDTGSVGLFTNAWGDTTRAHAVGDSTDVREVTVVDGEVVSLSNDVDGEGAVGQDEALLLGRGSGADTLAALSVGDEVSIEYAPAGEIDLEHGLGGNVPLVLDGQVNAGLSDADGAHPRSAIGVKDGGESLFLLTIDGRQAASRGLTYPRLAEYVLEFGAVDAINLDGGGSTTMVARPRGRNTAVQNNPSDGFERSVTNGLGVFFEDGSQELTEYDVDAMQAHATPHRLFPGITRDFTAHGYDTVGDPVEDEPSTWAVSPSENASVTDDGVVTGESPGEITVTAEREGISGEAAANVLHELDRVVPHPGQLTLTGVGESTTFTVRGRDADGWEAPIESRDVEISADDDLVSVNSVGNGLFEVTAQAEGAETSISIEVDQSATEIPVTIGDAVTLVSDFEDEGDWELLTWPPEVEASMEFETGRDGQVLRLDYDFTTTEDTRAAYAGKSDLTDIPEDSTKLGLWVDGDGKGVWLRLQIEDNEGTLHRADFTRSIDWDGWQHVEAEVPSNVSYPLTDFRIYVVETDADSQYEGSIRFDDLTATVPAEIESPIPERPEDRLILQNAQLTDADLSTRVAVLAGGALSANGNSEQEDRVRRALGEIVDAAPDALLICGNFVESGSDGNLEAAEAVLEDEIGDSLPVHYLPGPRERDGDADLDGFRDVIGEPRATVDIGDTQFKLLDSSTGRLRTADFDQFEDLQTELGVNSDAEHLVLLAHHAVNDPYAIGTILEDELEADFVQTLASDRVADSETTVNYVSGRGETVSVDRYDGVPHLAVGTLDADIQPLRAGGDARVWVELGVDADELSAEVRPLLTDITLEVPDSLAVDASASVSATGHQSGATDVSLEYPLTVRWSGSENLFVGSGTGADDARDSGEYDAIFDPETRMLEGLSVGEITIRIESNLIEAERTVMIEGPDEPSVEDYANDDGIVDTDGLRDAVNDWRGGEIETQLLRDVVSAWRSGEPVA